MASIGNIFREIGTGVALAAPGTANRANQFALQARNIQTREVANQLQAKNIEGLNSNREQQKKLNDFNILRNIMSSPAGTIGPLLGFAEKNQLITPDNAKVIKTLKDEEKAGIQKAIADGDITPIELVDLMQNANPAQLAEMLSKLNLSMQQTELAKARINLVDAQKEKVKAETSSSKNTQNILRGNLQQQPLSQSVLPSLTQGLTGGQPPSVQSASIPVIQPSSAIDKEIQRLRGQETRLIEAASPSAQKALVGVQKKITSLINQKKKNTVVTEDALGNKRVLDLNTNTTAPIDFGTKQKSGEELIAELPRTDRGLIITARQAQLATGAVSAFRRTIDFMFGQMVPGTEIAPQTAQAVQAVKSFNQQIKAGLAVNPRNPIAELKTIQGFLLDEGISPLRDPDKNVTALIGVAKRIENGIISAQNQINSGRITKDQRQSLTDFVTTGLQMLAQMPTISDMKINSGRGLDASDVERMSLAEIEKMPAEFITTEVATAMAKKVRALRNK